LPSEDPDVGEGVGAPAASLLGPSFASAEVRAVLDDRAWLQAMLDVEAELARAASDVGLVPVAAAEAVAASCRAERFDGADLAERAATAGNPVIPLVEDLRAAVPPKAAGAVHLGATSQDILDTSLMVLADRALGVTDAALARSIGAAAGLAADHRLDLMPGRTLLQHAVPITFGLTAATWLVGLADARSGLVRVRSERLAVQLGGAAGTLAPLGDRGAEVMERLAARLGLSAPPLPWHTTRGRVAELVSALAVAAGAMGKVAADVIGLMQTEVAEVREAAGPGRGGSSAMPHKRNPASATFVVAAAHQVVGAAGVVLAAQLQVHQRAAGPWHAEWEPVRRALELTAGAAERLADLLAGLEIDKARMRADLDLTGGLVMTEALLGALTGVGMDPETARSCVAASARRALDEGQGLMEVLASDPTVRSALDAAALADALDPSLHVGATSDFIDRALALQGPSTGATPR
jgi:3-carboxy-cis,cis-muconate cycloisomerase